MKKIIVFIFICATLFGFNVVFDDKITSLPEIATNTKVATGDTSTQNNLTYTVIASDTKKEVKVKSALTNDVMTNVKVTIPSSIFIDGVEHYVTQIDKDGFKDLTKLKEVEFPDTIEIIGLNAFSGSGIETVKINTPSLKTLESNSFAGCLSLTMIDFSYTSITEINLDVFSGSTKIEKVNISKTPIQRIPSIVFTQFLNLTSIDMSNSSITHIESSAFKDLTKLNNVILPEGLIEIGASAFSGCNNLDLLEIPSSVTTIFGDAFSIKNNDKETDKAIYLNSNYSSTMNEYMFDHLTDKCVIIVKKEHYNDYITNFPNKNITYEFDLTIDLKDYQLNSNNFDKTITVKRLNNKPFNYVLDEQTKIWYTNTNENLVTDTLPMGRELSKTINGYEYRTNGYEVSPGVGLEVDEIVNDQIVITPTFEAYYLTNFIDGEYTIIGISSYWNLNMSTVIPSRYDDGIHGEANVVAIGANAFEGKEFVSIIISSGIHTIEENAFLYATATSLTLPNGLLSIKDNAFKNSMINGVITIPSSVEYFGNNVFQNAQLNHVYLNNLEDYGTNSFSNISKITGGADPTVIAPSKTVHDIIQKNIDTDYLTFLVTVELHYNGGVIDKTPVVLSRLYNFTIDYVQNNDLTWTLDHNYKMPIPTKDGFKFDGWYSNGNLLELSTLLTEDVSYTAEYYLLTIASSGSNGGLDSKIYTADGIAKEAVLSINETKDSKLNDLISNKIDIYGIYKVTLTLNELEYNPNSAAYLFSIKLPSDIRTVNEYTVYAINEAGELEKITASVSHGYIVFAMDDIKDFALVNVPLESSMSTLLLFLILLFAIINGVQIVIILFLNRRKQRNIVTYNFTPLLIILAIKPNAIGGMIFIALVATAIFEFVYLMYLFITRNKSIYINQLPEPSLENLTQDVKVTVEDLENLLTQSHEQIDTQEDLFFEEYFHDELEVFIDEEPIREILSLDDLDDETGEDLSDDEDDGEDDEEVRTKVTDSGQIITIKFRKSFFARLNLTEDSNKDYYTILKNKMLSYKKINSRISWHHEAYNFGRLQAAKINVRGRTLFLYLPLDPEDYEGTKYNFKDCSHIKKYEQLPFRLKVKSKRGLKYALELIELVMDNFDTKEKRKFEYTNYYQKSKGFERLLKEGFIKEVVSSDSTANKNELNNNVEVLINPPHSKIEELNIVEEDEVQVELNIEIDNEEKTKFINEITEKQKITTDTTSNPIINEVKEVKRVLVCNPKIQMPPKNLEE